MPDIESAEQLKASVGLSTVHILPAVVPSEAAGVGFEFGQGETAFT